MTELWGKMNIRFTKAEDDFLRNNIEKCHTLYELVELFNKSFPQHELKYSNLQKRLSKLGLKKGTHNIRKEKIKSKNPIGHIIIRNDGRHARVKTENGYVSANKYFLDKYFGKSVKTHIIVNLNGDKTDFSKENVECVTRSVHSSMCWRGWFFTNPQLTKAAILTVQLLEFFPDLRHNENQYYHVPR